MNEIMISASEINNPNGNIELATKIRGYIIEREHNIATDIGALLAAINEGMPLKEAAANVKNCEKLVDDLNSVGKQLRRKVCDDTGASIILAQIDSRLLTGSTKTDADSSLVKLSAMIKECKAAIATRKEAEEPAAPVREIPVLLYATDEAVRKLSVDIATGKRAGIKGYKFASSEDDERKIVKLFKKD